MKNGFKSRRWYIFPILILAFIVISSMCPNKAPVIISITATPAALDWGGTSQIVVTATDDEGDVLSYLWVCHEGEFTTPTTGTTVTWQAPDVTGSYTITINVSDEDNTTTQSTTIAVSAHPNFNVSPSSLNFGETSTSLDLSITNSGTGELTWEAAESESWLSVSPTSGSTTSETDLINVTVDRTGLDPGTYTTTINITSNEDPMTDPALARTYNATINVQMEVPDPPELSVSVTSLDFGETTTALTFDITNSGGSTLTWTVTDNAAWLSTSPTSGSATTETDYISASVDRTGLADGHYDGLITVTSNDGTETIDVDMDVVSGPEPLWDFYDDFSSGEGNWTFKYCTHSIVGGELEMVSTHSTAQSVAETATFSPTMDIPWIYSGDLTIVSSTSQQTDNGISYHTNDSGTFDVEHMWLSIRKNASAMNWIWVWWIPSLANEWLPWDSDCYGNSSAVKPDGQKNTLEMSVDSNEEFTLKVNGTTLSEDNDAVNVMESMASINVSCGVVHLTLRGGNDTTTRWDNIIFDSESTDFTFKSRGISPPAPPSEEYVDGLLDRIARGEDVTLKTLLKKSLNQ